MEKQQELSNEQKINEIYKIKKHINLLKSMESKIESPYYSKNIFEKGPFNKKIKEEEKTLKYLLKEYDFNSIDYNQLDEERKKKYDYIIK